MTKPALPLGMDRMPFEVRIGDNHYLIMPDPKNGPAGLSPDDRSLIELATQENRKQRTTADSINSSPTLKTDQRPNIG